MTREEYKKHKEIIEAWSNGTEVEFFNDTEWQKAGNPTWNIELIYRIKPKNKTLYEWMVQNSDNEWRIRDILLTEASAKFTYKTAKSYRKTGRKFKV